MASKKVDIRIIEARVASLVISCWALVHPFYLINPKYKDLLGSIVERMELHHQHLLIALEQAEKEGGKYISSTDDDFGGEDGEDANNKGNPECK